MRSSVLILCLLAAACLSTPFESFGHSGRTDANGGHYNRKAGEYHYHNSGRSSTTPIAHLFRTPTPRVQGHGFPLLRRNMLSLWGRLLASPMGTPSE